MKSLTRYVSTEMDLNWLKNTSFLSFYQLYLSKTVLLTKMVALTEVDRRIQTNLKYFKGDEEEIENCY